MKKYLIFLLLPLFFACGPSDEQIKKDRDSLQTIIDNRERSSHWRFLCVIQRNTSQSRLD